MPIDREKVLQAAQKFVEKGRFDKAIVEYQRIVEEDPHDARILLKIGDLQSRTKTFEAASGTYERVGRHYASQGFAVKAVAVYKQIREIIRKHVPKLADQYGHILPQLARQYQTLGLTGDALAAYDEYATHLHRAGREREATEVFRTIVDINGTNPLARLRLAEALLRQGETDAAVVEFSIAGDTLVGMGRGDDALKVFERILYERPDPELARRTAQMYLQRGQTDDGMMALAKLQIAFQADTRDLDTLDLLARAFSAIGQRPKAFEVRKEIVRVAREKGNISLAKKTIEELVAEAPHDEVVRAMANSVFARDHGSKAGSLPAPPATASSKMAPRSALHPAAASGALASVEAGVSALPPRDSFEVEPSEVSIEIEIPESIPPIPLGRDAIPRSIRHVVVDESMEVAEDMSAPQPFDAASHAQSVIENANAFRKHRIYSKAIETLQIGLELNPASLSLHQALKSTLVEAGYGDHAVSELFTIASIQLDALDDTGAEQALSEVLQLDPSNNRARHMLIALGYEPPPAPDPSAPARGSVVAEGQRPGDRYPPASGALQANEPLPSYDLEEINPSYAMSQIPPVAREALPSLLTTDDPFGSVDAPSTDDPSFAGEEMGAQRHRLPSFSLHDDDLGGPRLIPMAEEAEEEVSVGLDAYDELADAGPEEQPGLELTQATPLAGTRGFQGGDSLEDALDEAEFFTSRGLFEDAMAIVEELVPKFPNHPLLLERIREIHDAASAASGSSGERAAPVLAIATERRSAAAWIPAARRTSGRGTMWVPWTT